ncbi:hypothetical protein ACU5DF_02300 [Aliivibrio wodanis]|uniref:hypothetical protein n=1 Tax=Aliivibrio wodanis TaxID=80852 RepID=UPI00406BEAB9
MNDLYFDLTKMLFTGICGFIAGTFVTIWRTKYTVKSSDFSKKVEHLAFIIDEIAIIGCKVIKNSTCTEALDNSPDYLEAQISRLSFFIGELNTDFQGFKSEIIKNAYINFSHMCRCDYKSLDSNSHQEADDYTKMRRILLSSESLKAELYRARYLKY